MARIDKTDSAVGVTRAVLLDDVDDALIDAVVGVSLDSSGLIVIGNGGQTGIVGVIIPNKFTLVAGTPTDIFKFAEIVDCAGLDAGTEYYIKADGTLTDVITEGVLYAGWTVEADRLVLRLSPLSSTDAGAIAPQAAPTIDSTPADATAVATDLQSLVDALVDAGVLTEA